MLFADTVGSTAMALGLDAEDTLDVLGSALKRMDFVSAGLFLNTLTNLQITGCSVTIRNPNQLIFALFGVLGINQVAHVERRKF